MAARSFGPTRGAGTRTEEQPGAQSITPAALGWVGYAGLFEKGPVGKAVVCSSKTAFIAMMGGIIAAGQAADAAFDFFSLANGAGGVVACRVTDGNERAASIKLYGRKSTSFAEIGSLAAANGGRWGGCALKFHGTAASGAAITETTLQIETANATRFTVDELKGGILELVGVENKQYTITGNTASGLVTVTADSTMKTDLGSGVDYNYYISLSNGTKRLAVQLGDGEENPDTEFSVEIFLDGVSVKKWGNLSVNPSDARYWVNLINNDGDNNINGENVYVVATDAWTGAYTASVRPANYYSIVTSVTTTVLTATIHHFTINSAGG